MGTVSPSRPFLRGLKLDGSVVSLSGPGAFAAKEAIYSAIHHRRMSRLPDIPSWLAIAHWLHRAGMAEAGHQIVAEGVDAERSTANAMTVSEAAEEMNKSPRTVRRLAETNQIVGRKTRNGWLLDRQSVLDYRDGRAQQWNCAS